jgi:hypothetical protein
MLSNVRATPAEIRMVRSRADRDVHFARGADRAREAMGALPRSWVLRAFASWAIFASGARPKKSLRLRATSEPISSSWGHFGQKGIGRLLLGLVAETLVKDAPCQVLTFRPQVSMAWDKIEPPCPDCQKVQVATHRAKLWCERHSQRHPRAHTYSELPESYGIGAQTFR